MRFYAGIVRLRGRFRGIFENVLVSKYERENVMKRVLATAMMVTLGLASAASASAVINFTGGQLSYTEDFEGWSVEKYSGPNGTAATDYWTSTGGYMYANDWWSTGYRLWNTNGSSDNTAWLNIASVPGYSTLTVSNATVSAEVASGLSASWWDNVYSQVWLLDASGNGYMGNVTHVGYLSLYTVTAGVKSAAALANAGYNPWTDNGKSPFTIADMAKRYIGLSAIDGVVTLTLSDVNGTLVTSATANNASTTSFTQIGIEGSYVGEQQHNIDNVSLTGSVPEAASLSVLGLGAVGMLIRKRR